MSVLCSDLGAMRAYVSGEHELILLVLRCLDLDAGPHDDLSYELLANEVPDLDLPLVGLLVLLEVDVDGEMGVDVTHLVLVALGDTDDQVVLLPVSSRPPVFQRYRGSQRTMRVRTVRRVATLLREPWWSSILMRFFLGCHSLSLCFQCATSSPTYVREADRQVTERLCELALLIVRMRSSGSGREWAYAGTCHKC
jgi:hypothetical protein